MRTLQIVLRRGLETRLLDVLTGKVLLRNAAAQWEEFLGILVERSPDDMRMRSLQSGEASGRQRGLV